MYCGRRQGKGKGGGIRNARVRGRYMSGSVKGLKGDDDTIYGVTVKTRGHMGGVQEADCMFLDGGRD